MTLTKSIKLVAITLITACALLGASQTKAEATIGQTIPHDLSLKNQNSEVQNFETLTGKKGLVLVFVRSMDWCPYCQIQVHELNKRGNEITDLGYNLAIISYDPPNVFKKFDTRFSFNHAMLSDEGSNAIKAFGILNKDFNADHFAYGVPHPRIYVIGQDKTIRAVLKEEGYKKRPEIDVILDTLKGK